MKPTKDFEKYWRKSDISPYLDVMDHWMAKSAAWRAWQASRRYLTKEKL